MGAVVALGLVALWYTVTSSSKEAGPSEKPRTRNTICDQRGIVVHEDQYWALQFNVKRDHDLQVTVRHAVGPPLDIFLMTPMEYGSFKAGGNFRFVTALSQGNIRDFARTARIASGDYVLVIDNSDAGDAKPPMNAHDDVATVDVRVSAD